MLGSDCLAQRRETLLRRLAGRVYRDVGLSIKHGPAVEYTPQILHRLVAPGHGTGVTLRDHARHMLLGLGLEPRREAGGEQELIGSGFGNDASARSDHGALVLFQHSLEAAPLIAPVAGLPAKEKDLREPPRVLGKELDGGEVEGGCDRAQKEDRNVALSAFELREVALRHPRITGKQLA